MTVRWKDELASEGHEAGAFSAMPSQIKRRTNAAAIFTNRPIVGLVLHALPQ
jgi:hypothetical protein